MWQYLRTATRLRLKSVSTEGGEPPSASNKVVPGTGYVGMELGRLAQHRVVQIGSLDKLEIANARIYSRLTGVFVVCARSLHEHNEPRMAAPDYWRFRKFQWNLIGEDWRIEPAASLGIKWRSKKEKKDKFRS